MIDLLQIILYVIYFQQIFFMVLINTKKNIDKFQIPFYIYSLTFIIVIAILNINIDAIKTHHLISYSIFVLITTYIFDRKFKQFNVAISLGFLLVFINSYYWESGLHIIAILNVGFTSNNIQQLLHLISVPLLLKLFEFDNKKKTINYFLIGLLFSFSIPIIMIDLKIVNDIFYFYYMYLIRIICLTILIKVFYNSKMRETTS